MPDVKQKHQINLRVYYEDTDFSGRVYHASYLRFFERGRTEWLRSMGISHGELARTAGVAFAVTKLEIEFHAAASIDDWLEVATEMDGQHGARLLFQQSIRRGERTLANGVVEVVTLKNDRAVRPPRALLQLLFPVTRR